MKNIIIFVVVVAGAYFAWNNLPGLRDQVTKAANKYGGWTEEARKSDPVGYIDYAIKQLDGSVAEFNESKDGLMAAKKTSEAKLEEARDTQAKATEFAGAVREQYKIAEETDGWPISVNGATYKKSEAVALVNNLLREKTEKGALMVQYQGILTQIEASSADLSARIADSKFSKEKLIAQKEFVKVGNLSAEADELLAKVNDLVEGNEKLSQEGPPTTYEDFAKNMDKVTEMEAKEAIETEANSAALDFLNG
jgi:phage shock protein A